MDEPRLACSVVARKVFVKMSVFGMGHGWESFPPNTNNSVGALPNGSENASAGGHLGGRLEMLLDDL
jgi:hypothetical protein